MKVVLHHPQIPQNTGNIGRLCVATQTELYLVEPLGFFLDSREIRRSGLDYWERLKVSVVPTLDEVKIRNPEARCWYLSTKGTRPYTDVVYKEDDILVFGSEGEGLPQEVLDSHWDSVLTIPMWGTVRSLNLATTVGIVLYEAYHQLGQWDIKQGMKEGEKMDQSYKIKVTTEGGKVLYWHKGGKIHHLPESLAEIWVTKFKPDLFEILDTGEMVGAGRGAGGSFKIAKVEKIPVETIS